MKRLGQHFLKNTGVVKKIVEAAAIDRGDVVIEIGPGRGALTVALADACMKAGAALTAIEKDERLAEDLAKKYSGTEAPVRIVRGDALTLLPAMLAGNEQKAVTLIGNLPYYITGKLFRILSESPALPAKCIFMVQREVAERVTAAPPHMNRLAAIMQLRMAPKIIIRVPREDFSPPPAVESAVLTLTAKPHTVAPSEARYYATAHALFAQPRKTVVNNLSAAAKTDVKTGAKETIAARLRAIGIDPDARPQNLSIEDIAAIAKSPSWG